MEEKKVEEMYLEEIKLDEEGGYVFKFMKNCFAEGEVNML